jgi:hypothetical protein
MQVSDILLLMGTLSVGNDNVTAGEKAVFLQYLNLANLELFRETASLNQDIFQEERLTFESGGQTKDLSGLPFTIQSVFDTTAKNILEPVSVMDLTLDERTSTTTGTPGKYSIQKKTVTLYPTPKMETLISVFLIGQPATLAENTQEDDIPYPPAFHDVLVDGALYYLFQQEGGFKSTSKELESRERWEKGKSRLLSYLFFRNNANVSTFSSV